VELKGSPFFVDLCVVLVDVEAAAGGVVLGVALELVPDDEGTTGAYAAA